MLYDTGIECSKVSIQVNITNKKQEQAEKKIQILFTILISYIISYIT